MFLHAERNSDYWLLWNAWQHSFRLPCDETYAGREVAIGLLGTRTRGKVGGRKTMLMTQMLGTLRRPLYLLDTRRNGVGGQSSWSPREFASVIPDGLPRDLPYAFLHLPCLAPSLELLAEKHMPWREFRRRYADELTAAAVGGACAFVEAAAAHGGLTVFLCSEADQPDFDALPADQQDVHYCHRFTLARRVAAELKNAWLGVTVQLVHLDLYEFWQQRRTGYQPRREVI